MSTISQMIERFLFNPKIRFNYLAKLGLFDCMSDEMFLKRKFKLMTGKTLNLSNPQTFNEKLQWLKIHNHNPLYTELVDKYLVRKYIAEKIGEEYLIPLLGVYDSPDDIDFDNLPNQFVLKCNHNSGSGMCICKDKSELDTQKVKKELLMGLKENYFSENREWPYKNVPRKIVCENFLQDNFNEELKDFKSRCFTAEEKESVMLFDGKFSEDIKVSVYTTDWERMPFENQKPASSAKIELKSHDEIIKLARKLSEYIPFSEISFYEIKNSYFAEISLLGGTSEKFILDERIKSLGSWIELSSGVGYLINIEGVVLFVHYDVPIYDGINDYKIFCFDGEPKIIELDYDRFSAHKRNLYTTSWNYIDATIQFPTDPSRIFPKPKKLDKMLDLSRTLSKGIPHVRTDFYVVNDQIYFGELTFYHGSGYEKFSPQSFEEDFSSFLQLPIERDM